MPAIKHDCPHCHTQSAGFSGNAYMPFKPGTAEFLVLLQCGVCYECIIVKVRTPQFPQWLNGQIPIESAPIISVWPASIEPKSPLHVPDNVKSFFLQGVDNLGRSNWDAAGTMFRKTLDTSLKKVHPEGKGTLEKRIDNLPEALGVTPSMKEWAHNIRDLGNDAAHEDDPFTDSEAMTLQAFTELFLTYVFTLPGMVAERKAPKEPLS